MRRRGMIETRRMTSADLPRIAEIQAHCPEAAQWKPEAYLEHQSWVAGSGQIGRASCGGRV